jgi:molybdopterin-biosynthesis enzyme MoeA-like protein
MLAEVMPRLAKGRRMLSESIRLDVPEGEIAELFAAHQKVYPDVAMGSYPGMRGGRYTTELVLRARDKARLAKAAEELRGQLAARKLLSR